MSLVPFIPRQPEPGELPRYVSSLAKCRVGDWQRPEFVLEWWGRGGVQKFQPPDRFGNFVPEEAVWLFQREPHPAERSVSIWRRIA